MKSQMYSSSASSSHILPPPRSVPSISEDNRAYSLSPSIPVASISRTASPTANLESDTIGLSLSSSMLHPTMALYSDPPTLSDQQYSIALQSGVRSNPQYLVEPSEYATSRSIMGSYPSLNLPVSMPAHYNTSWSPQGFWSTTVVSTSYH